MVKATDRERSMTDKVALLKGQCPKRCRFNCYPTNFFMQCFCFTDLDFLDTYLPLGSHFLRDLSWARLQSFVYWKQPFTFERGKSCTKFLKFFFVYRRF